MSPRPPTPRDLGVLVRDTWPAVGPKIGEELLDSITLTARRLLGAAACSVALLSRDESELVYTASARDGKGEVRGLRLPADQGVAGWVVHSEQPIEVRNLARDRRFSRATAENTGYVPEAILAVPVRTPRRLLGVLSALDRDAERPGAEGDLQLLGMIADVAALAIETLSAFEDAGQVLLNGVADALDRQDVARTLRQAAGGLPAAQAEIARIGALMADLGKLGGRERRLGVALLEQLLTYTEARRSAAG
ncbi:MAG: GAF domain-containing protein [Candidatus Dormibacteria bacterium]